jgi:hypothetical protein
MHAEFYRFSVSTEISPLTAVEEGDPSDGSSFRTNRYVNIWVDVDAKSPRIHSDWLM